MSQSLIKAIGVGILTLTAASTFSSAAYAIDTVVAVTVKLEGAASGATPPAMRTDLWDRNLLSTDNNGVPPQQVCADNAPASITAFKFSAGSKPVDWVCVELRESGNPNVAIASLNGVLLKNGFIVDSKSEALKVDVDETKKYHVVVRHKSHLSAASEALSVMAGAPGLIVHDLTAQIPNLTPYFGTNQKMVNGEYVMHAGDANQDFFIDGGDVNYWQNGNGFSDVYREHDVNLDGDINGEDKLMIDANIGVFHYIP